MLSIDELDLGHLVVQLNAREPVTSSPRSYPVILAAPDCTRWTSAKHSEPANTGRSGHSHWDTPTALEEELDLCRNMLSIDEIDLGQSSFNRQQAYK